MDPSAHAKKNPGWDPFLRLSVEGAQIDLACKSAILERHAAFSPQVGLQQYTNGDKAAGSSERGRIHLPTQLAPVRILILFPPYLGPPSEFFFLRTWQSHTYRNSTKYFDSGDTKRPQKGVGKSIQTQADQTNCQIQLRLEGLSSWQSRWSAAGRCKLEQAGATLPGEECSANQVRATSRQGQLASTRHAGPGYSFFFLRT